MLLTLIVYDYLRKTFPDFVSWSMSNEDQPFKRGGIVSML
jgi:hypothetical protein